MVPLTPISLLAVDLPAMPKFDTGSKTAAAGITPVLIALLLIVFGLIVWAVFLRSSGAKKQRQRGTILSEAPAAGESDSGRRRRKRRRREHRPRNPTLSETGGLPPLRPGDDASPPL
jgi:hypothetical protein